MLNLNSAAEVKKAFNDITARVKKLKGKPKLEGILIAQQVKAELELVVGASLDAEMGPVVLFGTGGVDIELMKDVALAGAPLDAAEAKALIGRTKAGVKIKGYRGKPALHEASAVKALVGLSNLMADAGNRIASIDVNPFLINTKTGVAVDALIVLNNEAAKNEAAARRRTRATAAIDGFVSRSRPKVATRCYWQTQTGKATLAADQGIAECRPTRHNHLAWEDIMAISNRLWSVDRRTVLKSGAAIAAAQFASPFIIKSLADEPVKIGMVNPLTGVLSALAQSEVDGARYAEAEINKKGGILGRQVQLLVEDSANDVGTGVQKTRKLIDRDQVDVILGDVNSGIAYAMSQVTNEKKIFHIVPGGHTDPITGTNCKWNVFRVCNTTTMDASAITPELVKKFGKKWFFITPDYAYGHTLQDGFVKALTKAGGTYEGDMLPINNHRLLRHPDQGQGLQAERAAQQHGRADADQLHEAIHPVRHAEGHGARRRAVRVGKHQGAVRRMRRPAGGPWSGGGTSPTCRVVEVRERLPRRDQKDALRARLVRLCVDAHGAAGGGKGEVAGGPETGEGAGGSRAAAGCRIAAGQGALSRRRSRTDAEHLRRRSASAEVRPR